MTIGARRRIGWDLLLIQRNGSSYTVASPADTVHSKSKIHLPAGRLVRSMSFIQRMRTVSTLKLT